jgi:DNA-binding transcriptional LysR family regulator
MENITLRQLEAYVMVSNELHFGKAAERLFVTAPWLSHAIKDLERVLHVDLLFRNTRNVSLTPAGAAFASIATQVLNDLNFGIQTTRQLNNSSLGAFKLGYSIGASLEFLPKLLRIFAQKQPEIAIQTQEFDFSDPTAGLRDRLVNIAVIRQPHGLEGLVSVTLAKENLVVCVSDDHPFATKKSVKIKDVICEPIIASPVSPGPWRDYWLLSEFRVTSANIVAEANSLELEMHLVSRGLGVSVTSEAVGRWYKRPGVTFIPITDVKPNVVSLAWRPQDTSLVAKLVGVANEFCVQ